MSFNKNSFSSKPAKKNKYQKLASFKMMRNG